MIVFLFFVAAAAAASAIKVEFGSDFPPGVPMMTVARRFAQLQTTAPLTVSLGASTLAPACNVSASAVAKLGSEGYLLVQPTPGLVCVFGNNGVATPTNAPVGVNRGLLYGTYRLLQELGTGFFHPLEATLPYGAVALPAWKNLVIKGDRYPVRGFHYHTEHPLELTEFLQGIDAGAEPWGSMIDEFTAVVEWLVANHQNTFEWVLLELQTDAETWSATRLSRIRHIVLAAQTWGMAVGADLAIADAQQHAWHAVTDPKQAHAQIERAVAWIVDANFTYISTESGSSEFTHASCADMLDWMNHMTLVAGRSGVATFIKCHCSTGQFCDGFTDPRGGPLNFNFLPMLANTSLGVLPHTVQFFRVDDPAPTYGNDNFTAYEEFALYEAKKRPTIWHPETAYWVSFDSSVPLFLPVYADSRIYDLQRLHSSGSIAGTIVFTSGWELGYWLNDVIAAAAAWDGPSRATNTTTLMRRYLAPVARATFAAVADQTAFIDLLVDTVAEQRELLVFGVRPYNPMLTGIGFLTGWDTWNSMAQLLGELGVAFAKHALVNPNKVTLEAVRSGWDEPKYATFAPLLAAMTTRFAALAARYEGLVPRANGNGLMFEMSDVMQMTALRAAQVDALYRYVKWTNQSDLAAALASLNAAQQIGVRRMAHFRVPVARIAAWRQTPTVYSYGYLWTQRSMMLWWRDLQIARDNALLDISPCLDNIVDPVQVAIGEGIVDSTVHLLFEALKLIPGTDWFDDCLQAPDAEPVYK